MSDNSIQIIPPEDTKLLSAKNPQNIRINTFNYFANPLKKRYAQHYKDNTSHLLIDLALLGVIFILVAVILANWLFWGAKTNNLMALSVESTSGDLINGQKVEFDITYTNTTKEELADAKMVLRIPSGLKDVVIEPKTFNPMNNTLEIGNLAPHAFGTLKISGLILDNIGEPQKFLAAISYKNKYGQLQQEYFSEIFDLSKSTVVSNLTLPTKIISGSPFYAEIKFKNNGNEDLQNLKVQIHWPAEYAVLTSEMGAIDEQNFFNISSLKVGEEKAYKLYGKLYINEPQKFSAYVNAYQNYRGQNLIFSRANATAQAAFSKFIVNFSNPQNNSNLSPGDQTVYEIYYKNNEKYNVTDVILKLDLSGEYLDRSFISQHYSIINSQIVWDKNILGELAEINAGEEKTIKVPVAALSGISLNSLPSNNFVIKAKILASFFDPSENGRVEVESPNLETKINSKVTLKTLGVFYTAQGDQIGVGSVPPKVGEYVSYWVVLRVQNTNNNVNNLVVKAIIPEGIEFNSNYNVTQGSQIRLINNQIEWLIPEVDRFSSLYYPAPEARIQLGLTPNSAQIGTSPLLLTNISATGIDAYTSYELSASGQNVSTAIFEDLLLNKVVE